MAPRSIRNWLGTAIAASSAVVALLVLRSRHAVRACALPGKRVVIVGAGVSGLAAAASLRQRGFEVTVVEARDEVGGLSTTTNYGGFLFNDGALFIAGLETFDNVFSRLGGSRPALLPASKVQCALRVVLPGGVVVTVGPGTTVRVFRPAGGEDSSPTLDEDVSARGSAELAALVARWLPLTRILEATLVRPISALSILAAGAWRFLPLLVSSGSFVDVVASAFSDDAVAAAVGAALLFQGASPQEQPAANLVAICMMCADGFFVPEGGMGAVGRALRGLCEGPPGATGPAAGPPVIVRTGCAVVPGGIEVRGGRVVGVSLRSTHSVEGSAPELVEADAVVVSASGMNVFGTGRGGGGVSGLLAADHVPRSMRAHTTRALQHLSHTMLSVQLGLSVSGAGRGCREVQGPEGPDGPGIIRQRFPLSCASLLQERPAGLLGATVHYRVPLLRDQAGLFGSAARYEAPVEYVSFIATTETTPALAPPGGCILECFAFLRQPPPGVQEAGMWGPDRTRALAAAVVEAVQCTLGSPLRIVAQRVRSPADLATQVRAARPPAREAQNGPLAGPLLSTCRAAAPL